MAAVPAPIGAYSGSSTNIFENRVPAGSIAANAAGERVTQGGTPHKTLAQANGAATIGMVDSINISPAARVAASIAQHNDVLTNSSGGPLGVQAVQGVIDGVALLSQSASLLSGIQK